MEVAFEFNSKRITRFYKVFENDIDHVLVEDLDLSERIDIELQALELYTPFVRNVLQPDHRKIRKLRKWADRRELRHLELDPDLSTGELVRERIERKEVHFLTRRRLDIEALQVLRL